MYLLQNRTRIPTWIYNYADHFFPLLRQRTFLLYHNVSSESFTAAGDEVSETSTFQKTIPTQHDMTNSCYPNTHTDTFPTS